MISWRLYRSDLYKGFAFVAAANGAPVFPFLPCFGPQLRERQSLFLGVSTFGSDREISVSRQQPACGRGGTAKRWVRDSLILEKQATPHPRLRRTLSSRLRLPSLAGHVSSGLCGQGSQLVAEVSGGARQTPETGFPVALFVGLGSFVHVVLAPPQHPVNQDGQFRRRGEYGHVCSLVPRHL